MAAPPPTYVQVAGTALYETREPGTVGWAGYVLGSDTLPAELTLANALKLPGSFLFAYGRPPQAATDPTGLARAALEYLRDNAQAGNAIVWLQGVEPAAEFGPFERFALRYNRHPSGTRGIVQSDMIAQLSTNLTFYALQSLELTVDDEGRALLLTKQPQAGRSFMGMRAFGLDFGVEVELPKMQRAMIPVAGPSCGCLTFSALVTPAQLFAQFGGIPPALQYAARDRATGRDRPFVYPPLALDGLPSTLLCTGTVDPSDPTNTRVADEALRSGHLRTGFAVSGTPSFPSAFRTPEGHAVSLVPFGTPPGALTPPPGAGAFAVASLSPAGGLPGSELACFSPAGSFGVTVAGRAAGTEQALLCGLFGSERLGLTTWSAKATANDALWFLPSQPAYAPVFPFETATLDDPESGGVGPRLAAGYRCAWATVVKGASTPEYSAEPEGSPLYSPQANGSTPATGSTPPPPLGSTPLADGSGGDATVLLAAPPSIALPQGAENAFPLVPYARVTGGDGATLTAFESQILAATRKTRISAAALSTLRAPTLHALGAPPAAPPRHGTTPQGLVVRIDPTTGAYLDVRLAQSTDSTGTLKAFAFNTPGAEVQSALQTNQLFLVAVDAEPFTGGGATFDDAVYIATGKNAAGGTDVWKLRAQVGHGATATSYRNVMILKFCAGSLQERVTNPNQWTAPEDFSLVAGTDPSIATIAFTGLSQWLQAYIAEGVTRADGPSARFYRAFQRIATDPEWNGVIVLRADLSADALPAQIQGLAAGIDFTTFAAHHFGFTVSRVTADTASGVIAMQGNSSIFGLIDYENPAYAANLAAGVDPDVPIPVTTAGGFDFTVLQLQARFDNARLVDFSSHVQLTVDRLFGSRVTAAYAGGVPMPANGVVLDGSYVDQNGTASFVFQQDRPTVFALDGNALAAVAMNRVQFNTLSTGATVASRFLAWGALDFASLHAGGGALLDVLSFGSNEGTEAADLGRGLAFSGLAIGMSFPLATPGAKSFSVDLGGLAWDLEASHARGDSLFRGFGLQLGGFVTSAGGQTPAGLGFLPVTTALRLRELGGEWYGVTYGVTMGGPGALAAAAGFTSTLLVAWSPATAAGAAERAMFVGLTLPGAAPGAKTLSLQGIFRVDVGAIALIRQESPQAGGAPFYALRLNDVALKVFGIAKLPPNATIQFFLFGDPSGTGSLGWYAAYVADDNPGCGE